MWVNKMGLRSIGFDEIARDLEKIGNIDRYAPELLEAASPILEKALKRQIEKSTTKGYATGTLAGSIKAEKPSKNKKGHYVAVTAEGKDKKGVRNNEKLGYLEYGTVKQAGIPVLAPAVEAARGECTEVMQKKLNEVLGR